MIIEAGVIVTGLAVAGSVFRLGWSIRGFRSDIQALGVQIAGLGEGVSKNGTEIAALYERTDGLVTKDDCKERTELLLRYVNGRGK